MGATTFSFIFMKGAKAMRRFPLIWLSLVGGLMIYVFGCSEKDNQIVDPQTTGNSNTSSVSTAIASDDFFLTEEPNLEDGQARPAEYGSMMGKTDSAIFPIQFGKKIDKVDRSTTYDRQSDSVVIATTTRMITGRLFIVGSYSDSGRSVDTLIRKPIVETETRVARFVRIDSTGLPPWKGWRLVALSLLKGGTQNTDIAINQAVIFLPSGDSLMVTSPNDYFLNVNRHPHQVPEIHHGDQLLIRLTLTSTSPDTDIVVLRYGADHRGFNRLRQQFHLVSETQTGATYVRVYEITVKAHWHFGKFNAVTEAITHQSIFDDGAPFENSYWGVPYVVR
jgi:hypothetical protein